MEKYGRWGGLLLVTLLIAAFAVPQAMAIQRTVERKVVFVGGSETRSDNEASFKLSYLTVRGDKGRLTYLNYQISSLKDSKVMVRDCQYLAERDGELAVLWKQTGDEKMDFYVDNLDPDPKVIKVYDKEKFFTDSDIPLDLKTGIVRWVLQIKGKTYNVDWTLKDNEITYKVVE